MKNPYTAVMRSEATKTQGLLFFITLVAATALLNIL
jgi:hypothetical protein